jgi:lantibiotic modifying enzyme
MIEACEVVKRASLAAGTSAARYQRTATAVTTRGKLFVAGAGGSVSAVGRLPVGVSEAQNVARAAFDWVESVAVEVDGGLGWLENGELFDDLYSGTAGVLMGCAEAAASGFDTANVASGASARLMHLATRGSNVETMPEDGLFSGWAGVVVALRAWSTVADDVDAGRAAARVSSQIADRVLHAPEDPARYTDVISGDAGILLALLGDDADPAIAAAGVLADRLVQVAEQGPGGLHWRMTRDWEYLMPGFSHGTAGIAYALAGAGRRLHRPDLIDVAVHGGDTLLGLGHAAQGWAVPVAIPPRHHGPRVNFGWCHGPTGTVRLFLLLDTIDPHPRWQQAVDACLRALADSGLPARLYPGFWDNLARCCGTAGVGCLLLDRYQASGDTDLLDWADVLAADVIERAIITPQGITWSNTEHTRTPPELPPEPGLMQGTAGIAGWLARLHALHTDRHTPAAPLGVVPSWL